MDWTVTDQDRAILDLERRFANAPADGRKRQAIGAELGMTITRYHQRLNRLLSDPAAIAHDPVLINRLRRLRSARVRSSSLR
jgi:hypothetical protein